MGLDNGQEDSVNEMLSKQDLESRTIYRHIDKSTLDSCDQLDERFPPLGAVSQF